MKRHVVFDESKHLDFEAPQVIRVLNPGVRHDWVERDLVTVCWIRTAECKAKEPNLNTPHVKEKNCV